MVKVEKAQFEGALQLLSLLSAVLGLIQGAMSLFADFQMKGPVTT